MHPMPHEARALCWAQDDDELLTRGHGAPGGRREHVGADGAHVPPPHGRSHNGGASAAAGHAAPLASPAFASVEAAKILGGLPGGGCYNAPAVHHQRGWVDRGGYKQTQGAWTESGTSCKAPEPY